MKNFYFFNQKSRKNEFAQMFGHIYGVVINCDAEALKIAGAVEKVAAALPLLEELKVHRYQQPLTHEQQSLVNKIDKGISALSGYIGVKLRHTDVPEEDAAQLYHFINTSLKAYSQKNSYGRMSAVNKMLQSFAADASLSEKAELDECGAIISKLRESYAAYDLLYQRRRKAINNKEKSRTEAAKRKMYYVLRDLLASIDIAAVANPDLDYKPLISELNMEISRFNAGSKPKPRKKAVSKSGEITEEAV